MNVSKETIGENAKHIAVLNSEMGDVKKILECHTTKLVKNEKEHGQMMTNLDWIIKEMKTQTEKIDKIIWSVIIAIAVAVIITLIVKAIGG